MLAATFGVPFIFGLVAFQRDFLGLGSFVAKRLASLNQAQKTIVGFLAIAHHYGQQSLPSQAFSDTLALPRNKKVDLTTALPQLVLDLLVSTEAGLWRTAHDLVATEILEQMLTPALADRRVWSQQLSAWAVDFGHFCRGWNPISSEEMLEVARRTFVYRDNTELLGTERAGTKQFAQLIQEIPSQEGKLVVLKTLTELYPEEAHFWAHLGRFYSMERRDHENALIAIDRAIVSEPSDSVLHHMKGMALRQQAYEGIQQRQPLDAILKLGTDAGESFAKARELSPDDDHGYISDVQMILKMIDYAGGQHPSGVLGYIGSPTADPYLRDCLERAEDLLERVRARREGEGPSHYEETCRGEMDALYGQYERALQVFDSLLTRQGVFCPPVRRQIVWTYLARRGRRWDHLTTKELDRTVSLLEENLSEEPHKGTNLRLWVQAVRRSSHPPSLENVIEKVSYWRANADSLEATYYLYVLYSIQAIEGSTIARDFAMRFRDDCRARAGFRRNRTRSFEWLGRGSGIGRLVHHGQLGEWRQDIDFWENTEPLGRGNGRISRFDGPQAGEIEVSGGLPAFFVPAKGGFFSQNCENRAVTFLLGFSYDGLRAWDAKEKKGGGA
jgi:tetratricopeptide (TPR) repeat protein